MKKLTAKIIPIILLIFFLSSCSPLVMAYSTETLQGIEISNANILKLRLGMCKNEVKGIMGEPSLIPLFDDNLWGYVFYKKNSCNKMPLKKYTLLSFKNGCLKSYRGDFIIYA